MDDKDRLLLTLLRRDARASTVALARDLGLSRSATQERLTKLQASGAITGFTLADGSGGGARQLAYLSVVLAPGRRCAQIMPTLRKLPAIASAHSVTGVMDLILMVEGEDVAAIETVRQAVAATDGVADVTTHIVLQSFPL